MIHIKHGDKELWVHWSETKTFCADWDMKPCFGKCNRCVWQTNGGCSMWNGEDGDGDG